MFSANERTIKFGGFTVKRTLFLIATILFLSFSAIAQQQGTIEIKEADGSPRLINPKRIIFPNGTLTKSGQQISFLDSLVPTTGSGASGRVAIWTGTSTLSSNAGFLWDNTNLKLTVNQGTLTTSQPFLNHTATWNAGGVTFTNLLMNVTDTASAAGSLFADYQVGGTSKYALGKTGGVTQALGTITASTPRLSETATWNSGGVTFTNELVNITDTASASGSMFADWQIGGSSIFQFQKSGLIRIAQGTVTASSPWLSHTATWNSGATTFSNATVNITNTASAAGSKFIDYQIGGTTKMAVDTTGGIIGANSKALTAGAATAIVLIDVASGGFAGGFVDYTVNADDGTDFQARTGRVGFQVVNKAGTETCVVAGPAGNANATETQDGSSIAASNSTLTYTWGVDTTPTNGCKLTLNAASGLTETTLNIRWRITGTSGTPAFTAQ